MSQSEHADGLRRSTRQTKRSRKILLEEYSSILIKLEEISYENTKEYEIEELKDYAEQIKEIYNQYAKVTKEFKQSLIKEEANAEVLELLKEFKENKHDTSRVLSGVNKQLISLGDHPVENIAISEAGSVTSHQDLMDRFLQDVERQNPWNASIPRMSPTPSVFGQTPPMTPALVGAEGFTPINRLIGPTTPLYPQLVTSQCSTPHIPHSQPRQLVHMLQPPPPAAPPSPPPPPPPPPPPSTVQQPPSTRQLPMQQSTTMFQPPPGYFQGHQVSFADPSSAPYQDTAASANGISYQLRNLSMSQNKVHVPLTVNNIVLPNVSSMYDFNQVNSMPVFTPSSQEHIVLQHPTITCQ